MLIPRPLERATHAYRLGYFDGFAGRTHLLLPDGLESPFARIDYLEGVMAGARDVNQHLKEAGRTR